MELFRLFGSIMIDDQEAIKAITGSEKQAKNAANTFDNMANAGFKIGGMVVKGMAIAGVAMAGLATKGVKSADDLAKAINGVEASTGLADDSSSKFRDTMLSIYNQNLGDSFEDIGAAMAEINQQTGLTGEALEDTTKNALILRDTFDMEVNESVRAAEMMMDTFGVTSEEAYNLIAQGAQNGLNKNGDLLDVVNEYSKHFEQMGFSSEEMFNMLANGAEDGTFSVDKLGDAVKEFGVRSKDGSKASQEAFATLGLDAEGMTAKFAEGGEVGKEAYKQVTDALFAMEDPVAQNQAGVALFGTMFEDLGVEGIEALSGINGEADLTKQTMDEINSVKYETVGEAIEGIGRVFETGVLIPIGEKILPKLEEFANKIDENMPQIQTTVDNAMTVAGDLFDGFAEAIQWASENLNIIVPLVGGFAGAMAALTIIGTVRSLIVAWKATTFAQTLAQHGLNAALNANPIGIVITIIGLLIAAGIALYMNWDTVKEKALALWNKVKIIFNGIKSAIVNTFDSVKSSVSAKVDEIVNKVKSTFSKVKSAMSKPFETAKNVIKGVIDKVKGFLNFKWKFPKLKMPSFSISGSANPLKWIDEGVPKLKVSWNAKGAIFNSPTIFGTQYGYQGVGEAGPEAVLPISRLAGMMSDTMKQLGYGDGEGYRNIFNISNVVVREEADIPKIAKAVIREQEKVKRAKGMVAYGNQI